MATYKNNSVGAHVHGGKVVAPGATFDAKPTPNLEKLVKAEILQLASAGSAAAAGGSDGEDKAALVARAKELGVPNAGANWGVEKLKEAIAEAEKKAGTGGDGEQKDA